MSSQLLDRLGVQEPQIVHQPPDVVSLAAAEEAIELADAYGVADGFPLDEAQRFTLRLALGERADGSWAAATVADFEPRQNGKNDTCGARELAGLVLFGERLIIHTAHEFPTANESFLRLVAVFENWDDLRRKVARIRYANGEQGIELLTGQRLKYRARTGGSGRGFAKADLVVYDEAQHLQAEHVAASGPARLANPNNQSWYMGSGGLGTSHNAWRMRRRALAGEGGRFAYVEHTAERVSLDTRGRVVSVRPEVLDREAWARANSAYGFRITDESMLSLYQELGSELFARECLCVWDPELGVSEEGVIPRAIWDVVCSPDARPDADLTFGVDVNLDRSAAAIVAGGTGTDPEGNLLPVAEVVEHRGGLGWLVDRAVELNERWDRPTWAVDGRSTAPVASFVPKLRAAGLTVVEVPGGGMPAACGDFLDAVVDAKVRVRRHASLDAAVDAVDKRFSGDAWVWDRKDSETDISPLYAATIALWAHQPNYDVLDSVR